LEDYNFYPHKFPATSGHTYDTCRSLWVRRIDGWSQRRSKDRSS